MDIGIIGTGLHKGETGKAVKDFDKYIDYFQHTKKRKPERLICSHKAYDALAKKATTHCEENKIKRDGKLEYKGILIEKK